MPKRGWVVSKNKKNVARSKKGRENFYSTTTRPIGACKMCNARILLDQSPSNLCSICMRSKYVAWAILNSTSFPEVLAACRSAGFVYSPPIPLWVYRKLLPVGHPSLWQKILDEIFK